VALAPELNSDYCIDCYRAFVPEIKIRILQQAFNMEGTWKDVDFGCAKQYDDDTMQIQLIGAGNEYWTLPNWILEFWCKKPGCKNGHMGGSIPTGTPLPAVVAKCRASHPECDTCSECSSSSETDDAPGISMAVTTVVVSRDSESSKKPKASSSAKSKKKDSASKSASSLESSKASKKKSSSASKSKKSSSASKKISARKNRSASKPRDDPFAL
jgi:hypothetical protein